MTYFDQAATSYPKPPEVYRAMMRAMTDYGANPGRGGYAMALKTDEALYRVREEAARLFGLSDPRRAVLMPSCTVALNTVIRHVARHGGRVLTSDLEHNAVVRPLKAAGVIHDIATVTAGDEEATLVAFSRALTPDTRAIVCSYASNVTGAVLPIRRLAALAHKHGIPLIVDAAQAAGVLPIDVEGDALDYVCVAGHKGVFGPMGTGLLLCREERPITPLYSGGTGSGSLSPYPPETLPERLESGTPNVPGFVGLGAGLRWVRLHGTDAIAAHERSLAARLYEQLSTVEGLQLHSPPPVHGTAVLSFTSKRCRVAALAEQLAEAGIAVRGGLHCAPLAHRTAGTLPDGTVRISLGAFNTRQECEKCVQFLKKTQKIHCFSKVDMIK